MTRRPQRKRSKNPPVVQAPTVPPLPRKITPALPGAIPNVRAKKRKRK